MTISSTTVRNSYSGDGTTDTFNYTFKIFADTDLQVIIRSSTATETVKTLTTEYTVTGAGNANGGTVVFTAGNIPTATETVVIRRAVPQTQAIDYIANDPFPAESHEEGLDRAMMTLQQVQEEVTRSIKLSRTNTMTSTEFAVGASDRANKILAFDTNGELAVTQELGTFQGDWTTATAFNERDLVKDTTNNNIYLANTAHTSSGSLPISTNTDSAKWDLIVDAASATSSATAAATSATNAANSATTATTQAGIATTQAGNASTSASNASTSETNASNSATAASNSATAALNSENAAAAIFDNFDDSYLGAKASNPTLDNDGDALQDGALYFDTTNNVMKVYDLGSTTWYQLTPTVSNQNNINTLAAISSDVTQAASDSADIQTVASDSADIRTLADIEDGTTATNAVSNAGNNATSIVTVAGQISPTNNISSVAAIAADITSVANIDTDVTAVANDATDIGIVATDLNGSDNIGTVATDIANVNNVGGSIANVNTVATNIASVNNFGEVYRISATAPTTSLDAGDLYFDTATDTLKVYGSSGWQNAGSSVNGTSQRYNYTATSGQTTFTGSDNNGNTLTYDAGYIDVYLNGVKLLNGTDVTVTSGTSVVLATGATAGDIIDIVAYGTFSVASLNADNLDSGTVPSARISGAYTGITQTGTLSSFASTGIDDNATSTAITIDSSENVGIGTASPSVKLEVSDDIAIRGGSDRRITLGSNGTIDANDSNHLRGDGTNLKFNTAGGVHIFEQNGTEAMRIDSSGNLLVGKTTTNYTIEGCAIQGGLGTFTTSGTALFDLNRLTSDGNLINFYQANTKEGDISVSGSTVSYNGFTGTHWSRFTDNSTPTILRGTVLESLDEMCDWYNLEFETTDEEGNTSTQKIPHVLTDTQSNGDVITYNHEGTDVQATIVKEADIKHVKSKVSDTVDAKNVYGVFVAYDEDGEGYNDFYVASVGSFVVRIKQGETVAKGDLLQSNGDGTAKVQTDDNIKSSSFAKVLSTTVIETYDDGSFIVPCSLMC